MKVALASLALLSLSACAVGPDFARPDAPGATSPYLAAGEQTPARLKLGEKVPGAWWRLFGAPDLDAMVVEALAHNEDIKAADATLSQVQEQFRAVSALSYPQASLHGGLTREKVNFTSYGINFLPATQNLYSVGATVSYAIDVFGHDRRAIEASLAKADSERFRAMAAELAVTGNVVLQYLTSSALQAQIEVLSEVIADDHQRVELVRSARRAGTLSDLDMATAEQQTASDSAQLAPLKAQRAAVRHALSLLVGKSPGEFSPPDIALASYQLPTDIPLSQPSELVHQRPDILAAEAELHAANAAIGVAEANRFPRLILTADITQWAKTPNQLWQDLATGAAVGGGITAPLLEGGRLEAQQRAAESGYQAASAHYRQTILQSFAQVATAMQAMEADEDGLKQSALTVKAARQALDFATLRRGSGTLDLLSFLAVKRQERISRLAEIQAQTQCLKDSADIFLALGGGWWDQPNHL